MKTLTSIICLCIATSTAFAQKADSIQTLPKENIEVNKTYDDNGNLTKYDSTYIYNWTGDSLSGNLKINKHVQKYFSENYFLPSDSTFGNNPLLDELFNEELMWGDSYFKFDTDSIFDEWQKKFFDKYEMVSPSDSIHRKDNSKSSENIDLDPFFNDYGMGLIKRYFSNDSTSTFQDNDILIEMRNLMKKHWEEMKNLQKEIMKSQ